jgi:hypothetical protein
MNMFCTLAEHFRQQNEALMFAAGKLVGPIQPIVRHMAEQLLEISESFRQAEMLRCDK